MLTLLLDIHFLDDDDDDSRLLKQYLTLTMIVVVVSFDDLTIVVDGFDVVFVVEEPLYWYLTIFVIEWQQIYYLELVTYFHVIVVMVVVVDVMLLLNVAQFQPHSILKDCDQQFVRNLPSQIFVI
jgi:hypothetical protein